MREGASAGRARLLRLAPVVLAACNATTTAPSPAPSASSPRPPPPPVASASASVQAPDPTVTLAADLEARAREARTRFGADVRVRTVDDLFVLVEVGPRTPLFDRTVSLVDRALRSLFDGRIATRPSAAVTALLFTQRPAYDAYCVERYGDSKVPLGVYRRELRELAADLSGGAAYLPTVTHEIVHPLIETDFPRAPLWIDEAIASLYEAPTWDAAGAIHGEARNWRHEELEKALRSDRSLGIDRLFGMTTRQFKARSDAGDAIDQRQWRLNYALARSFAAWLDGQGKLWPFYAEWRRGAGSDPTGRAAFEKVMGATPEAMNPAWRKWAL